MAQPMTNSSPVEGGPSPADKQSQGVASRKVLQDIWVSWMLVCYGLLCSCCDRGHRNEWYRNSEKEPASNSIDICIEHTRHREWSRSCFWWCQNIEGKPNLTDPLPPRILDNALLLQSKAADILNTCSKRICP